MVAAPSLLDVMAGVLDADVLPVDDFVFGYADMLYIRLACFEDLVFVVEAAGLGVDMKLSTDYFIRLLPSRRMLKALALMTGDYFGLADADVSSFLPLLASRSSTTSSSADLSSMAIGSSATVTGSSMTFSGSFSAISLG